MESVILCEPNSSGDPLLSATALQQAVAYRDVCYTATGRTSSILKAANSIRATSNMGSKHHQAFLSTNLFISSSPTQALEVDVPRGLADTPLATAVVVQSRSADSDTRVHLTPSARTRVACGEVHELEMAAGTTQNQSTEVPRHVDRNRGLEGHAATRQGEEYRQMVNNALDNRLRTEGQGTIRVIQLMGKYGIRNRTTPTNSSIWKCWMDYCKTVGEEDLSVSDSSLLWSVGWLADMRDQCRRKLSHTSLIKYISGIKSTHQKLTESSLPEMPTLNHATNAYKPW